MPVSESSVVEFLGGPMDGHFDACATPLKPFVIFPSGVHRQETGILAGLLRILSHQRRDRTFLWAVYELQDEGAYPRYRHVRTLESPGIESLELLTYVESRKRKQGTAATSLLR